MWVWMKQYTSKHFQNALQILFYSFLCGYQINYMLTRIRNSHKFIWTAVWGTREADEATVKVNRHVRWGPQTEEVWIIEWKDRKRVGCVAIYLDGRCICPSVSVCETEVCLSRPHLPLQMQGVNPVSHACSINRHISSKAAAGSGCPLCIPLLLHRSV